jgi:catechol 2,3-dioxygenase-like lactoylglutathione lyase family enzyme
VIFNIVCYDFDMKIKNIDHIVLTVSDIDTTVEFYQNVLGMELVSFAQGRTALTFGSQKINLHQHGKEFEPRAQSPLPGSVDLCFITETPLEEAMSQARDKGVSIIEGPADKTGALGRIKSFYFRDPDMNLIEVANYV